MVWRSKLVAGTGSYRVFRQRWSGLWMVPGSVISCNAQNRSLSTARCWSPAPGSPNEAPCGKRT